MQVATRLICESLKEFPCESEPKCGRHILPFFWLAHLLQSHLIKPAPHQKWTAAEVNHTASEAFVHWHVRFAFASCRRIECEPIPPNAFLIAERLLKSLAQHDPAIFNGVVRIHFQIT